MHWMGNMHPARCRPGGIPSTTGQALPVIDVIPLVSPHHLVAGAFGDEGCGDTAGGQGGLGPPVPVPGAAGTNPGRRHSPSELGESSALMERSAAEG